MMRILVAVDLSESTTRIVATARKTALATKAEVYVIHVTEPNPAFAGYQAGPPGVRDQVASEFRDQHRKTQEYAEDLRQSGVEATALLLQGSTAKCILDEANKLGCELIVMGTHGRTAVMDVIVGSVSHAVLRNTDIPVLLVPVGKRT